MTLADNRSLSFSNSPGSRDFWEKQYSRLSHNQGANSELHQTFINKLQTIPEKDYTNPLSPLRKATFGELSPAAERLADRNALTSVAFNGDKTIARAQASLAIAGYKLEDNKRFGVTGVADHYTTQAITDFQKAAGLEPTGKPDLETMKALDLITQKGLTKNEIEALGKQVARESNPLRQIPQEVKLFDQLTPEEQQRIIHRDHLVQTEWNGQGDVYIAKAQASLKLTGYDVGQHGIDGKFGPDTSSATLQFQKDRGLNPTGILDTETKIALNNATSEGWTRPAPESKPEHKNEKPPAQKQKASPKITIDKEKLPKYKVSYERFIAMKRQSEIKVYQNGSPYDQVRINQARLQEMGFNIGSSGVDGILGQNTRHGIAAFQQAFGLPVTGELNRETVARIESEYVKGAVMREISLKTAENQFSKQNNNALNVNNNSKDSFSYNWTGKNITPEFKAKVLEICRKLEVDPDILMAIMAFESGFDPAARNKKSGATGLIQFMKDTAIGLGTTIDALAKMSAVEQLDFVYMHYKPYAGKIHSIGDAYMVTFMPIAIGKDDKFKLGVKDSTEKIGDVTLGKVFEQNSNLDIDGDGIITKKEAYTFVENIIKKKQNKYFD